MKCMRTAGALVALLSCGDPCISAQTFDRLQIRIEGNIVRTDSGEQPSVGMSSGPLELGKMTRAGIEKRSPGGCGLGVAARLSPDAIKGWSFEVTPTRVQDDVVTFHLRWTRVEAGKEADPTEADLTLRPGESIPIDMLSLTPAPTDSPTCRLRGMTARVKVDFWPPTEQEARLVATDLWLVEKAADGSERTQPLTVRGLPNQNLPFFFAPLTEGGVSLDIYGDVESAAEQGMIALKVLVRSRIVEGGQSSTMSRSGNYLTARKIGPVAFKARPGEVISLELPRLSENQSGAFASKTLSLRIRSQQVR